MIDRNSEILRNKLEVLERRKAELLREIANRETQLTSVSATFGEVGGAGRIRAILVPASPDGRQLASRRRHRGGEIGTLRTGFKYGLIASLIVGIILVFFAK